MMNLGVGAVAGVINVVMTTPLWGVMTVLTTQRTRGVKGGVVPYRGMLDGLIRLGKEEGVSGLWKGLTTNLILVSNPTVHYFIYDRLKIAAAALVDSRGKPLNSAEFFLMGAIAKCIATIVTYPIQVAQSQLRNDRKSKDGKRKYAGTFDCLVKIYQISVSTTACKPRFSPGCVFTRCVSGHQRLVPWHDRQALADGSDRRVPAHDLRVHPARSHHRARRRRVMLATRLLTDSGGARAPLCCCLVLIPKWMRFPTRVSISQARHRCCLLSADGGRHGLGQPRRQVLFHESGSAQPFWCLRLQHPRHALDRRANTKIRVLDIVNIDI